MNAASYRRAVFVDTSGFFGIVNRRDTHHEMARAVFSSLQRQGRPLLTSNFIIAETHAMLLAKTHQVAATTFLRETYASAIVVERISEEDEIAAREIVYRYQDKQFSLADATSFVMMERLGIGEAFTFDRNFTQYGFRIAQP